MAIWKSYNQFSQSHLEESREFLLNDILHQVIAFIAVPKLNDNQSQREQTTLSLNLSYIQDLEAHNISKSKAESAKTLLQLLRRTGIKPILSGFWKESGLIGRIKTTLRS